MDHIKLPSELLPLQLKSGNGSSNMLYLSSLPMWHPLCPVIHTSYYQNSLYIHPIYVIILIDNTVPFYRLVLVMYSQLIYLSSSVESIEQGRVLAWKGMSWRNIKETIDNISMLMFYVVETKCPCFILYRILHFYLWWTLFGCFL